MEKSDKKDDEKSTNQKQEIEMVNSVNENYVPDTMKSTEVK